MGRKTYMDFRVFVIEDDINLANNIVKGLKKYQYTCLICEDFSLIDEMILSFKPHLILLDINLPKFDGYYWCREIRKISTSPILIISSRDSNLDQIRGIESGADDFIIKPFAFEVLMAKIQGFLRRSYGEFAVSSDEEVLKIEDMNLYVERQKVELLNVSINLTSSETKLLSSLMSAYPRPVSRNELFLKIWDTDEFVEENTLNVNIGRLRNKVESDENPLKIRTIRSFGYQLVMEETLT